MKILQKTLVKRLKM